MGAFGQAANGVGKIDVLVILDEGKNIAALVAAETMKDLLEWIDVEAGALFLVERAKGDEIGSSPFQRDAGTDNVNNITGGADLLERRERKNPRMAGWLFIGRGRGSRRS